MNYAVCRSHAEVTIETMELPHPGQGEIVVRLSMCGICGTDVLKIFGNYPKPQKLGHEVVGIVHTVGGGVVGFKEGERVALAHHVPDPNSHYARRNSETMDRQFRSSNIDPGGFSQFIRVPALHVPHTVAKIPSHVPDRRAVFMEPMACCLRALDRLNLQPDDTVLVVGVGAVGILFMPLFQQGNVATIAADVRAERLVLATRWGACDSGVVGQDDVAAICKKHSKSRGVDAVVLTVVNTETMQIALQAVRDGGTIMIFGGKPGLDLTLPMWDIWLREINVLTSYSATPHGLHRAMEFLATDAAVGLEALVSHMMPLADSQLAFEMVRDGKASKVVITP
jgi:L-iditol 2-dehydrogenase